MKTYILLLTALLVGCSQSIDTSEQVSVASDFYNALMKNDIKSARKYISDKENLLDDGQTSFEFEKYSFSEISTDKNLSHITTSIPYKNGVGNFSTVLSKVNGKWKVVFKETMKNMISNAIEGGNFSGSVKLDVNFETN